MIPYGSPRRPRENRRNENAESIAANTGSGSAGVRFTCNVTLAPGATPENGDTIINASDVAVPRSRNCRWGNHAEWVQLDTGGVEPRTGSEFPSFAEFAEEGSSELTRTFNCTRLLRLLPKSWTESFRLG